MKITAEWLKKQKASIEKIMWFITQEQSEGIKVRIFEDRVEIESPGLLPYNITAFNIGFVRSDGASRCE